jgi:hypothetical protein
MTFIKDVDQIRDYSYVELAVYFGKRMTAEEILAYAKDLSNQLAATSDGSHLVEVKKIDREGPLDKE